MASRYEEFWKNLSFAFVGHTAAKGFPKLSYGLAKQGGKRVFAVDPSVDSIDGDETYPDLESLPQKVDAAVLEVPKREVESWVRKAAEAGIGNVWIHMGRETPEAIALAKREGMNVLTGTCAVMYVKQGLSYHSIHKWLNQAFGKY